MNIEQFGSRPMEDHPVRLPDLEHRHQGLVAHFLLDPVEHLVEHRHLVFGRQHLELLELEPGLLLLLQPHNQIAVDLHRFQWPECQAWQLFQKYTLFLQQQTE